jgi:type II secretory pathway pseudopilin PulG
MAQVIQAGRRRGGVRRGAPASAGRRGYSLVEVIVSLGILTGVIVAIASMFVLAQSNVKSGKLLTEATSVAQEVMEDLHKLSYNGLQASLAGSTVLTTLNSFTADTRTSGTFANTQYQGSITSKLYNGWATITLQPIGGNVKPATFASGEAIRITVTVNWTELRRNRSVTVEGVRF